LYFAANDDVRDPVTEASPDLNPQQIYPYIHNIRLHNNCRWDWKLFTSERTNPHRIIYSKQSGNHKLLLPHTHAKHGWPNTGATEVSVITIIAAVTTTTTTLTDICE
jgi:hypothetical protein